MVVNSLTLKSFRSYDSLSLNLSPNVNVFIGNNGEGKTNILESIYTLAITKSYKAKEDNLIKNGADFARITSNIELKDREEELTLIISKQGKIAKKNSLEIKKLSDFIGEINVVLFSPEDLMLLKNGPQERRKLMDVFLYQTSKKYVENYTAFKKQLKLRNDYLKYLLPKLEEGKEINDEMLDVLTTNFIECNKKIYESRKNFIEKLETLTDEYYKRLSGTRSDIKLNYITNFENDLEFYKDKYKSDLSNQTTQYGCHRDDIKFLRDGIDLENSASQGELRMLSLSIKLALARIIYNLKSEAPIVLLDDVLSELDINHQNRLLSMLDKKMQIIITTTDVTKIKDSFIKDAKIFNVVKGSVKEIQYGRQ